MRQAIAGVLALALGASLGATGCATNAATGRRQFNFLSRADEIALGEQAAPQLTDQYGGEVRDARLTGYVDEVARTMLPHVEAEYRDLPWEFTLLDSDVINAFALPGGKVFVSRGLAERMSNEAQLAGVLGHEMGHVTAEHADKHMSRQWGLAIAGIGASILAGQSDDDLVRYGVPMLVSGAGVFSLTFSRDEELEADRLGVRYMTRAGYDPVGQLGLMRILVRAAGSSSPPEFLSTHPAPQRRVEQMERLLAGEYAHTQNNPAFGLYESRFRDRFLNIVEASRGPRDDTLASSPVVWCAHCRAAHAQAEAAAGAAD